MKSLQHPIILASSSPRRKKLLKDAGFDFSIVKPKVDESYPADLDAKKVPAYLALKKAKAVAETNVPPSSIILSADTVVLLNNKILEKPDNLEEAQHMLKLLSGKEHSVVSSFTLLLDDIDRTFTVITKVKFRNLSELEINFYINKFKPFDKAGAYGIQEWIGLIGVEAIEGDYYNVVGLPIQKVYQEIILLVGDK